MIKYFGLSFNDLDDFCQSEDKGSRIIDVSDGIFIRTFIAKLVDFTESFAIIRFDDEFQALKSLSTISLKSFKNQNEEIKVKLFDAVSNVTIRDNFKYIVFNNSIKSENNKQTYYFTLTKDEYNSFVYKTEKGNIQTIITAIWNDDHTNFTLKDVLIQPVITVSLDQDLFTFCISGPDSRYFFSTNKNSHNAYEKIIYLDKSIYKNNYKNVEFFTSLDDCLRFTKSKKKEPGITNKLEEQWSWDCKPLNLKSEYPYFEHSMSNYTKERLEYSPITTYVKYNENDIKFAYDLYKEKTMVIKDVKKNGPATIIFWLDGEKTIVKCQPGDQDDIEKGVIMALVKGYCTRNKNMKNWTKIFDIPYADEVDVEKVIGLGVIKDLFGEKDCNWHYNYVLKWVYKIKEYTFVDEVKTLLALGYSKDRIKKCLKTNLGAIRDALNPPKPKKKKTKNEVKEDLNTESELGVKPTPQYDVPIDGIPLFNNELLIKLPKEATVNGDYIDHINLPDGRKLKFVASDEQAKKLIEKSNLSEKIVNMFNSGIKISKIAKELNITEYFVKKALDEITKPKANPKKAERILKKATKEKIVHKKHIRRTEIEYPDYLDKETCDMVLERTKEKYKDHDKIQYLSELQKYFTMECKREYIMTHYGNGYDMYTIAKVLGINAASVQRIWNACKSGKEQ